MVRLLRSLFIIYFFIYSFVVGFIAEEDFPCFIQTSVNDLWVIQKWNDKVVNRVL